MKNMPTVVVETPQPRNGKLSLLFTGLISVCFVLLRLWLHRAITTALQDKAVLSSAPTGRKYNFSRRKGGMVTQEDDATIVVDVGSSSVKAGFSGEDTPRAVFPSVAEDMHLSAEDLSTYRARRPEVNHDEKMRHARMG